MTEQELAPWFVMLNTRGEAHTSEAEGRASIGACRQVSEANRASESASARERAVKPAYAESPTTAHWAVTKKSNRSGQAPSRDQRGADFLTSRAKPYSVILRVPRVESRLFSGSLSLFARNPPLRVHQLD
jgi:hypothetical protein